MHPIVWIEPVAKVCSRGAAAVCPCGPVNRWDKTSSPSLLQLEAGAASDTARHTCADMLAAVVAPQLVLNGRWAPEPIVQSLDASSATGG